MDANKGLLWIAGAVFVVAMIAGNTAPTPTPVDPPGKLESSLLAVFLPKGGESTPAEKEKARTDLLMFAGLNYCVANAVETCDESTGLPELKTGEQVQRFRKLQRMMVVGNKSFVTENKGLGQVLVDHFTPTLGPNPGEITDKVRPLWKSTHFELGQASARACQRVK